MQVWSQFDWPRQTVSALSAHAWKCHLWVPMWGPVLPLVFPPVRMPLCSSKTAAWRITCVRGPPCSCPAVRPLLINAQAGARPVWQHKTNNATTQPSLLLTEMQPAALFRPLQLHSTPCSRPSKRSRPSTSPPSPPAPACTAPPNFHAGLPLLLEAEPTLNPTHVDAVSLRNCTWNNSNGSVFCGERFLAAQSIWCSGLNVLFFQFWKEVCVRVWVRARTSEGEGQRAAETNTKANH